EHADGRRGDDPRGDRVPEDGQRYRPDARLPFRAGPRPARRAAPDDHPGGDAAGSGPPGPMSPRPIERPGRETHAPEPEFTWGETPAGPPTLVWEHAARPLWAQVAPAEDVALLIEKERLILRRASTGELLWEQPAAEPPE